MLLDLIGKAQAQTFAPRDLSPLAPGGLSLRQMILNVGVFIVWIAGALALGYLIYGGILYITAGGDPEKATKGRTAIVNAVIGIIIVFMALIIINWVRNFASTGNVGN